MEDKYFELLNKTLNIEWIALEIDVKLYNKVKRHSSKIIKLIEKNRRKIWVIEIQTQNKDI